MEWGSRNLKILSLLIIIVVLILLFGVKWEDICCVQPDPRVMLMNDIQAGKKGIGITLHQLTQILPGNGQDLEIILKNNESDSTCYMLDIELLGVDAIASSAYFNRDDCLSSSCPDFAHIKQDAERWFLIIPNIILADPQEIISSTVSLQVPADAKPGKYGFAIFGYFMNPMISSDHCKPGLEPDQIDTDKKPKISSFVIRTYELV